MPDITPVVVILNGQPVSSINPLPTSGGGGGGGGIVEQGKQGSIASPWFVQPTADGATVSLPLPTGAATDAKQDTGNASLASIDGKVATAAAQATGNTSCQGNAEVHGIAEGPPVAWMAVKAETLAGCALGNGWTWRVWGVRPDDRPRENGYLDTISLSSWRSRDTNCPSSAPSPADNLPDFYARNPTLPAYLLMPPGYGGAVGEVTP